MNKTVSINIGGFFFHIDEKAYERLTNYLTAIKSSLDVPLQEEVMKDIECRIAELFMASKSQEQQVVSEQDVDKVIDIMGDPKDYQLDDQIDDRSNQDNSKSDTTPKKNHVKRLYRDKESGILGGVLSGLGHYLGVEPIFLRVLTVLILLVGMGFISIVYLLFWLLVPKAVTTAQKLEMKGEPINISTIEQKVKEGVEQVSSKLKDIDHNHINRKAKSGISRLFSFLDTSFKGVLSVLKRIIGLVIVIGSLAGLVGLTIGSLFVIFNYESTLFAMIPFELKSTNFVVPLVLQGVLLFLTFGIPLFLFLLLGFRLLFENIKSIGRLSKIVLLVIWVVSLICVSVIGLSSVSRHVMFDYDSYSSKVHILSKEAIKSSKLDTIKVKMVAYQQESLKTLYQVC